MMIVIALFLANLKFEFCFKRNIVVIRLGYTFFHALLLDHQDVVFKDGYQCPNLSLLTTKPLYTVSFKRCGSTMCMYTQTSSTKRSVLQKFFRLTLILVHILIFHLISLNYIFSIIKPKLRLNSTPTLFSPIDSFKSLVGKEGREIYPKNPTNGYISKYLDGFFSLFSSDSGSHAIDCSIYWQEL